MEIERLVYVSVAALAAAWVALAMCTMLVFYQNRRLLSRMEQIGQLGKVRVQKAKVEPSSDYSYQNPNITPGEELSRRGYSMYSGSQDLESGQSQSAHPVFIEDLIRQRDPRPPEVVPVRDGRSSTTEPPPFLLQSIEEKKTQEPVQPVSQWPQQPEEQLEPQLYLLSSKIECDGRPKSQLYLLRHKVGDGSHPGRWDMVTLGTEPASARRLVSSSHTRARRDTAHRCSTKGSLEHNYCLDSNSDEDASVVVFI